MHLILGKEAGQGGGGMGRGLTSSESKRVRRKAKSRHIFWQRGGKLMESLPGGLYLLSEIGGDLIC